MAKFLAAIILSLIAQSAISSQTVLEAFNKARPVLDRSISAYGGLAGLNAVENVTIRLEGESVHRNQSRRPGAFDRTPYAGEVIIDMRASRTYQTQKGQYPGGFHWHQGNVVENGQRTSFDLIRKTSNVPAPITPALFRVSARWLPQIILQNVLERAESLRYLGKADFEGRPHDIIDYVANDGARLALYIDQNGVLSKFEQFLTDRYVGDSILETRFPNQRKQGDHLVPSGRVNVLNGDVTNDFRFASVAFNQPLPPEKFKIPAGLRPTTFPPAVPVTKIADKIYTTSAGGYNVLFVDFKDHIFVMEAPGNDRVSQQAIQQIKRTIPGKPIKYVAVTHHHDDHAGGIRAYMAEGATLIVAPGEKDFFQKVSTGRFTAEPDILTRNFRAPVFETLQNRKRVLTDGETTIEIHDIGSGPHAEEMLVAYLPKEKTLYQGDLLNRPPNGDYPIANDTSAHFLTWIDSSGLAVERLIPVHGTLTTMEEFRKAVADMK